MFLKFAIKDKIAWSCDRDVHLGVRHKQKLPLRKGSPGTEM